MSTAIQNYLQALQSAMADCDRAMIQDALWDSSKRIQRELDRLAWMEPDLTEAEAETRALAECGRPEDAAEGYRSRERSVQAALRDPVQPIRWPTFLGIYADSRTYTSLVYLFLSFLTGIAYFTWTITGLSLSASLLVVVIGLPLGVFFMGSFRALAMGESRLVESLLDIRMPRRPSLLPEGATMLKRLGHLFSDGFTWRSVAYLTLQMPLGCLYFSLLVSLLATALGLLAAPVFYSAVRWNWSGTWHFNFDEVHFDPFLTPGHTAPMGEVLLVGVVGFLLLTATLHLALMLGRLHGRYAKALLVARRASVKG